MFPVDGGLGTPSPFQRDSRDSSWKPQGCMGQSLKSQYHVTLEAHIPLCTSALLQWVPDVSAVLVRFLVTCQAVVGRRCSSGWLLCFIIHLREMVSPRSSGKCKLCFTANQQDHIYSAGAANLLQMRTDVRPRQVGKGYNADMQLA